MTMYSNVKKKPNTFLHPACVESSRYVKDFPSPVSGFFNPSLPDMEFLEVLTEGLNRVLLVRGGGREVITIYS